MSLLRDVYPLMIENYTPERDALLREAEDALKAHGAVQDGDLIVLTIGEPIGKSGGTNTLKIVRVGEHRPA
jgi:pyruvate kinase